MGGVRGRRGQGTAGEGEVGGGLLTQKACYLWGKACAQEFWGENWGSWKRGWRVFGASRCQLQKLKQRLIEGPGQMTRVPSSMQVVLHPDKVPILGLSAVVLRVVD